MQNFIALMRRRWGESRQELMYCRHGRGGLRKRHPGHRARSQGHTLQSELWTSSRYTIGTSATTASKISVSISTSGKLRSGHARCPRSLQLAANMGGMGFIEHNKALMAVSQMRLV